MLTYVRIRAIGGKQPELRKLLKASSSLLCYKLLIKQCACTFAICMYYIRRSRCNMHYRHTNNRFFYKRGQQSSKSRQVRNEEDGLKNVLVRRFPTKLRSFTAFDR